jgi:hypothetical protein
MGHRTLVVTAFLAFALSAPGGAALAKQKVRATGVIELFTSQGCNSCPPADALLDELANRPDIVALAWHVDYWDYLGWSDTLGDPENTRRQYDYAKAFGRTSVYTPQAVVNGKIHVNGARRGEVDDAFADTRGSLSVEVKIWKKGGNIVVEAGKSPDAATEARLLLVYFDPQRSVAIERGENAGRTIVYRNAVVASQTAGMWQGEAIRFELQASEVANKGASGCAALLQAVGKDGAPGAILGAAIARKPW